MPDIPVLYYGNGVMVCHPPSGLGMSGNDKAVARPTGLVNLSLRFAPAGFSSIYGLLIALLGFLLATRCLVKGDGCHVS